MSEELSCLSPEDRRLLVRWSAVTFWQRFSSSAKSDQVELVSTAEGGSCRQSGRLMWFVVMSGGASGVLNTQVLVDVRRVVSRVSETD